MTNVIICAHFFYKQLHATTLCSSINSVTQAAMKTALKRTADILNSIAGHMLHVSQHKVDEILSNSVGDIRNAVLNLIFISLKGKHLVLR